MSGVKHTPGPWELVSLSGYGSPFSVRMPYIATTANVGQTHYGVQSVRRREDALLIAAAPDLLEAAQNAIEEWGMRTGDDDALLPSSKQPESIAALMRALARARGEQDGGGHV